MSSFTAVLVVAIRPRFACICIAMSSFSCYFHLHLHAIVDFDAMLLSKLQHWILAVFLQSLCFVLLFVFRFFSKAKVIVQCGFKANCVAMDRTRTRIALALIFISTLVEVNAGTGPLACNYLSICIPLPSSPTPTPTFGAQAQFYSLRKRYTHRALCVLTVTSTCTRATHACISIFAGTLAHRPTGKHIHKR